MPFVLCVNNTYRIEATAAGKLDIPNTESFPYDSHDFAAMGEKELLGMLGEKTVKECETACRFGQETGRKFFIVMTINYGNR